MPLPRPYTTGAPGFVGAHKRQHTPVGRPRQAIMQVGDGGNHGVAVGNPPDVEREAFAAVVVEQQGNIIPVRADRPITQFEEGLATGFMAEVAYYLGRLVWVSKCRTHECRILLIFGIAHEIGICADGDGRTVVIIDQARLELIDE